MRLIHGHRGLAAMAALVLAGGALLASGTASAAPGNDGTIKLDGVAFDDYPNNEPHVGCVFQLDFYGYDEGNYNARVAFVVKPPTGKNIPLLNDTVFIGEDPAGGGTDLDASRTYDIEALLQAFMAHPQQGYHVKVVVRAPGSIGADKKYKTFWVENCGAPY